MIGILSVWGMPSSTFMRKTVRASMVDMANVTFSPDCRLSVLLSVYLSVCLSGEYTYDWDPVRLRDAIVDVHEEDGVGKHGGYGQRDLLTRLSSVCPFVCVSVCLFVWRMYL